MVCFECGMEMAPSREPDLAVMRDSRTRWINQWKKAASTHASARAPATMLDHYFPSASFDSTIETSAASISARNWMSRQAMIIVSISSNTAIPSLGVRQ